MSAIKNLALALSLTTAAASLAVPAQALNMLKHNARVGCGNLVTQAHPDLKGRPRIDEIHKCKNDPEGYNKAAGF